MLIDMIDFKMQNLLGMTRIIFHRRITGGITFEYEALNLLRVLLYLVR